MTQTEVKDKADGAAADAQEKAKEVAGQAQEKAKEASGQARDKVREQVDQRSTQAGEQVKSTAGDIRTVAEELRKQGNDTPARYAGQAADRAERVGSWLADSDGDRILRDIEDFGRRNPMAVVAGGLALGFMASRLLKASSSERYRGSFSEGQARSLGSPSTGNGAGASPPTETVAETTAPGALGA